MKIYCCNCQKDIDARLTSGAEIYPHRTDLYSLPFWKCDSCGGYVGTHNKSNNIKMRKMPLGCIASLEIKQLRLQIHAILDPLWKEGMLSRSEVYGYLTKELGYEYHTGETRTVEEAERIIKLLKQLKSSISGI